MKATVFHGARDVRVESVPEPTITAPTDALVRVVNAAICGSDLWPYRGVSKWEPGSRLGHEFTGVVEAVGKDVRHVRVGQFVAAPFSFADGTCAFCESDLYTSCPHVGFWGGANDGGQGEYVRVPYADATLVPIPDPVRADPAKRTAALALTDVMGTGFHGVKTAGTAAGSRVVVIGDGAVGLCAVQSARYLGAEQIIAVGHHPARLELARRFGATETVDSHDPEAVAKIKELTKGGAPSVVEAVGMQSSLDLALDVVRDGGTVSFVGVPAGMEKVNFRRLFSGNVSLRGALAPVRAYLPELMAALAAGQIDPGPVFTRTLPLTGSPEGYAAMDGRSAIKVCLDVSAA
ncbi:MAG TPA: zinc-binding dehydrogenase [Candidatus Limnocylindria bacterium]|jgi:threonine dehydrogenase-like Zn-dependent dehydrogenase|nr:zinc-binding dehydrogenase [Candidatus Limnocylindria bacterium]